MSLPESITYGGAILAQAASPIAVAMNKANYGHYVSSSNAVDQMIHLKCQSSQNKNGVLDSLLRFERFRNYSPLSAGVAAVSEQQLDRILSVQIRVIAPLSTNSSDGRFTQSEILDHTRGMGSLLYESNFLERLLRGEL